MSEANWMKKGSMLISTLCAMLVFSLTFSLFLSIIRILLTFNIDRITQHDVFKRQIFQRFMNTNVITCGENDVYIGDQRLSFHNNRIVSTPGYEILLDDVQSFQLTCNERAIELEYTHHHESCHVIYEIP